MTSELGSLAELNFFSKLTIANHTMTSRGKYKSFIMMDYLQQFQTGLLKNLANQNSIRIPRLLSLNSPLEVFCVTLIGYKSGRVVTATTTK